MFSIKEPGSVILATGNSYIKFGKTGSRTLVMGKGAALDLKQLVPGIDIELGAKIDHLSKYGIQIIKKDEIGYGVFQTKIHFKDPSTLDLIQFSINKLKFFSENNPNISFNINFPGINNGGLLHLKSEIQSMLEILPNNVSVWEY